MMTHMRYKIENGRTIGAIHQHTALMNKEMRTAIQYLRDIADSIHQDTRLWQHKIALHINKRERNTYANDRERHLANSIINLTNHPQFSQELYKAFPFSVYNMKMIEMRYLALETDKITRIAIGLTALCPLFAIPVILLANYDQSMGIMIDYHPYHPLFGKSLYYYIPEPRAIASEPRAIASERREELHICIGEPRDMKLFII